MNTLNSNCVSTLLNINLFVQGKEKTSNITLNTEKN